jgi:type IV pilus assembly protein PilB
MITRQDLDRALALQKGSNQRLGEVLVDMELLTHADLAEVLEEQLAERDEGLVWR